MFTFIAHKYTHIRAFYKNTVETGDIAEPISEKITDKNIRDTIKKALMQAGIEPAKNKNEMTRYSLSRYGNDILISISEYHGYKIPWGTITLHKGVDFKEKNNNFEMTQNGLTIIKLHIMNLKSIYPQIATIENNTFLAQEKLRAMLPLTTEDTQFV